MADKRWEYRIERFAGRTLTEDFLNERGAQGWEMVGMRFDPVPADAVWLVFKREKAPDYSFLNSPAIESAFALGPDGKFLNPDPGAQRPEGASPEGS